jgi:SWI/SNF-related matrix-associated actin-dependent regulator 1 of chromatin subfamily A
VWPLKTPKPYQREDSVYIAARKSALVAHEPRVGKSGIAILAADILNARIVVILCPANVKNNWRVAIEEDFRRKGWVAVLVSWNKAGDFLKRWTAYRSPRTGEMLPISVLIIDESHFAKSRDAQRTRAVYGPNCDGAWGLSGLARNVYCLTGTPLPKDPTDLWPMLRAIAPELIMNERGKPMSWSAYRDKYCRVINTGFGIKIGGSKNYKILKKKLEGFMIRRTRAEVFGRDIQPPTTLFVEASREFSSELKALEDSPEGQMIASALDSGGLRALAKMAGAHQLRQLFGLAKVQGLSTIIADELDEEPGSKQLILCWHTKVIDAYANALRKYGVIVFDGRSGDAARKARLNHQFQHDPRYRLGIGQISSIGVGLDWSEADVATFGEQSWVGDDNEQARSRIFNMENPRPKFTRFAVLPGSTDSRVAAECARKLRDSGRILS